MSHFDNVEITFHGGPFDGVVSLPSSKVVLNQTPLQSSIITPLQSKIAAICACWGDAHNEGRSFVGTEMLLAAVPFKKHLERMVQYNQDVNNKYRVDSADLAHRTLHVALTYLGTSVADTHKPAN
jgi:hypothetical protein